MPGLPGRDPLHGRRAHAPRHLHARQPQLARVSFGRVVFHLLVVLLELLLAGRFLVEAQVAVAVGAHAQLVQVQLLVVALVLVLGEREREMSKSIKLLNLAWT